MFHVAVTLAWLGKSNQLPGFVVSGRASLSTTLKIGVAVRQSRKLVKKLAAKHCSVNTIHDAPERGSGPEIIN